MFHTQYHSPAGPLTLESDGTALTGLSFGPCQGSRTALSLFDAIREVRPSAEANCGRSGQGKRTKDEIGMHAIRMGNIVGVHEVMIGTQNERITLKHEAFSRGVFAEGSLKAAAFLVGKTPGMYDMKDLLKEG